MNPIGIRHVNYYIPEKKLPVEELLKQVPDDRIPGFFSGIEEYAGFIKNELKVEEIRIEDRLKDYEMLTGTVEKIFIENIIQPDEIDIILLAQESNQRQKDNLGQYIQYVFDLNNAYVVEISGNNCANIDYALTLATSLANGNKEINNILILGNVKIEDPVKRILGTYGLVSDGSGTILVSKGFQGPYLLDSVILSAGEFHKADLNEANFQLISKYILKCIHILLEKTGATAEKIQHVIIQNANSFLITHCLGSLGIDSLKIFSENKSRYAHLDCLDFLINLKDLIEKAQKNDDGLILSFGTGGAGSFISSLFTLNNKIATA